MVDSAETPLKIMGCIGGVLCFSWRAHQFLTHLVFFLMFPFFSTCVLCTTLSNCLALSEHSELEQPAVGQCITLFFHDMVDSGQTPFKIMGSIGGVLCFSWRAHQFLTHLVFFLMFPFFSTCVLCTTLSNCLALSEHSELEQPAVGQCITLFFHDMVDSGQTPFKIMGCIGGVLCFSWRAHQFLTHLVFFLMFPFFSTCVLCTTLSNCLALSEHSELEQPAGRECITLFFQDMVDSAETPFKIMGCIGGVLCFSWRAHQFLTHLVFFLMFPFFFHLCSLHNSLKRPGFVGTF
ncbi:hypothetical protein DFJ73DRAFT_345943 [Zopfochytrium polystomum]|nr:hypothetical protein DFJ73DRAFT_345943 [Zopfochytrium polystomum]